MSNLNAINSYDMALNISDNEYYINHTTGQYFLLGDYKNQLNIKGVYGYPVCRKTLPFMAEI